MIITGRIRVGDFVPVRSSEVRRGGDFSGKMGGVSVIYSKLHIYVFKNKGMNVYFV